MRHDYRQPHESTEVGQSRSFLYALGRFLGDVNAVRKGRVGRRIGRRVAGKYTGRGLGRLFK
ncbi:MAG: hypothetical protein GEU68_12850 [Actinobacteria bacterium]|nr:hypothetical protein [Actinomycetota bacterium]